MSESLILQYGIAMMLATYIQGGEWNYGGTGVWGGGIGSMGILYLLNFNIDIYLHILVWHFGNTYITQIAILTFSLLMLHHTYSQFKLLC